MERGARHFAFISRSGADQPEAAHLIENINTSGGSTRILRADASDDEAVRQALAPLHAERPIRGVVHGAMVLKVRNAFFEVENEEDDANMKPKLAGWYIRTNEPPTVC